MWHPKNWRKVVQFLDKASSCQKNMIWTEVPKKIILLEGFSPAELFIRKFVKIPAFYASSCHLISKLAGRITHVCASHVWTELWILNLTHSTITCSLALAGWHCYQRHNLGNYVQLVLFVFQTRGPLIWTWWCSFQIWIPALIGASRYVIWFHMSHKKLHGNKFFIAFLISKEPSFEDTTKPKPVPSYSLSASSSGVFICPPNSAWATNQNDAILYDENAFVLGDPLFVGLEICNCNPDDRHHRDNTTDVTKWSFVSSIYWWQNPWRSLFRWQ